MKTVGVIVTYNRKDLLMKNIDMLLKQTKKLDNLIIIDNNSYDGTYETLKDKYYLDDEFIIYERLPHNTGGAGGFYYGTKIAYKKGYDFIFLMDDDGRPYREDTFERLYEMALHVYKKNKKFLLNSLVTTNGKQLSFSLGISNNPKYEEKIINNKLDLGENLILNKANPFNGTLITKETIKEVGYPRKEFFISCDEVDYFYRCLDSGVFIGTVIRSIYYHPKSKVKSINLFKWKVGICDNLDREYYYIRNKAYSLMKKNKIKLLNIILLRLLIIILYENYKINRIRQVYDAFNNARLGKMGERNNVGEME